MGATKAARTRRLKQRRQRTRRFKRSVRRARKGGAYPTDLGQSVPPQEADTFFDSGTKPIDDAKQSMTETVSKF